MGKIVVSYGWTKINPLIYKGFLVRETGLEDEPVRPYRPVSSHPVAYSVYTETSLTISSRPDLFRPLPSFRWLGHRLGHHPVTRLLRESCFHFLPVILIRLLLPVFFITVS